MDRYRIYESRKITVPVVINGKPAFDVVDVPGQTVMVGGKAVTADPTKQRVPRMADAYINDLVVAQGDMPADRVISYDGKAVVHSIVAYAGPVESEAIVGVMTMNEQAGPFSVTFADDDAQAA